MRIILLLVALAATGLAGCAESGSSPADEEQFGSELDEQLVATDTTGIIRGVVITETIQPIAEATVRVIGTELETMSNEAGEFGFADLEPGAYFLEASKLGFNITQGSAVVEAAVEDPPVVKLTLIENPSSVPFAQTIQFDGYLECSAAVVVVSGNLCGLSDLAGVELDDPLVEYPIDRVPTFIQVEMTWESTQPAGEALELLLSWDCSSNGGFLCDHGVAGVDPLVLKMEEETIVGERFEGTPYGPARDIMVRVFGTGLDETDGEAGVVLEQQFTHFTTIFYGFTPDEDWTYIEDGAAIYEG